MLVVVVVAVVMVVFLSSTIMLPFCNNNRLTQRAINSNRLCSSFSDRRASRMVGPMRDSQPNILTHDA